MLNSLRCHRNWGEEMQWHFTCILINKARKNVDCSDVVKCNSYTHVDINPHSLLVQTLKRRCYLHLFSNDSGKSLKNSICILLKSQQTREICRIYFMNLGPKFPHIYIVKFQTSTFLMAKLQYFKHVLLCLSHDWLLRIERWNGF